MRASKQILQALGLSLTILLAASGCATAASSGTSDWAVHPDWQGHMEAGLAASHTGELQTAALHYRRAVQLARNERLPAEELAFSTYHLAEAIRGEPGAARGETALGLLDESRRHFESCFGADHPVLIPVWVRLAVLHAEAGDRDAAASARARADGIAVRFFPESHFLRERFGVAHPAAMLHPIEVLHIVGAYGGSPDQMVQGP